MLISISVCMYYKGPSYTHLAIIASGTSIMLVGQLAHTPPDFHTCVRVMQPGGYLELRYVRMTPGQGVLRPRGRVYVTLEEEAEFDMPKTEDYGPNTVRRFLGIFS